MFSKMVLNVSKSNAKEEQDGELSPHYPEPKEKEKEKEKKDVPVTKRGISNSVSRNLIRSFSDTTVTESSGQRDETEKDKEDEEEEKEKEKEKEGGEEKGKVENKKRRPLRRASTLNNPQEIDRPAPARENRRSSFKANFDKKAAAPKMDAYTASKRAAGIDISLIGGRDESFAHRCRRLKDLNSIIQVFVTIKRPHYTVRYSKVKRGPYLFKYSMDPFQLSDDDLQQWTDSRASSKTNGVQIDAKKSIIGADFVGVINQLFLNPDLKKIAPGFFNSFMWSHDSYISRFSLLRLFCIYYLAPPLQGEDSYELHEHIVEMICDWIALQYPILREDSKWVKFFEKFMGYLKSTAPNAEDADVIGEDARSVKNIAYHRQIKRAWKTAKAAYSEMIHTSFISQQSADSPLLEFIDVPAWSLAQQLTFIDQSLIQSTPLIEYRIWADKADLDRGKLGNLCAILDMFHGLQLWVASTILVNPGNAKERAKVVVHWVHILEELQKMQNLHSAMAIFLGLKMQPVKLLTSMWNHVPKTSLKTLELVEQLFDVANDFSSYHKYVDSINKQNPYIPAQTIPLLELAEASELTSLERSPGELNWLKINEIGKVMESLRQSRMNLYKLEESPTLQRFIIQMFRNALTETELFAATALRDEKNGRGLVSPYGSPFKKSTGPKRKTEKKEKEKTKGKEKEKY